MNHVFADTSFWIALLSPKDDLHALAVEVVATLGDAQVVTSEMVLAELLNDFAGRGRALRTAAWSLVESLRSNRQTTIVPQTSLQFQAALGLYGRREDKSWGFTDMASFLIMKTQGINDALTYDQHFQQMGFRALLR